MNRTLSLTKASPKTADLSALEASPGASLGNLAHDLSLENLLQNSPKILEAIASITHDLYLKTDRHFDQKFKGDDLAQRLKIQFWDEYRRAQDEKSFMRAKSIYHGVCSHDYFHRVALQDKELLAWLIRPPVKEMVFQKQLILRGMERLQEVLELDLVETTYNQQGKTIKKVNVSLIKEIRTIVEMLQNRVHGAVIQRQQNLNVNVGQKPSPGSGEDLSMKQIEGMLKKIDGALGKIEAKEEVVIEGEVSDA